MWEKLVISVMNKVVDVLELSVLLFAIDDDIHRPSEIAS